MSRGPGRWQRFLLDALQEHEYVLVTLHAAEVLGRPTTRAEDVALRRAAKALAIQGKARGMQKYAQYRWGRTGPHLALARVGSEVKADRHSDSMPGWMECPNGKTLAEWDAELDARTPEQWAAAKAGVSVST